MEVSGKDEKCAYALCVASTAAEDFLPFQQVWNRKTKVSSPKATVAGMEEVKEIDFEFTFASSPKKISHFSALKTMKEVSHAMLPAFSHQLIALSSGWRIF